MEISEKVEVLAKFLDEKLAEDVKIIDFSGNSSIFDYFILATARNLRHINALLDDVKDKGAELSLEVKRVDYPEDSSWGLVDLKDIVVHIFLKEERQNYNLEKLWGDLRITNI